MPYEYLEDEAIADIAFKARGKTLEDTFEEAAKAVYTLLTNIEDLCDDVSQSINLNAENEEKLLYMFLDEIIYLKDAELFFPKSVKVKIIEEEDKFLLTGRFTGCEFNYEVHTMGNDIKAITYHDFYLKKFDNQWECYVLVDI